MHTAHENFIKALTDAGFIVTNYEQVAEFDDVFVAIGVNEPEDDFGKYVVGVFNKTAGDFGGHPEAAGELNHCRKVFAELCVKYAG